VSSFPVGTARRKTVLPFQRRVPGFFGYLREARGLRLETVREHVHHLGALAALLDQAHSSELAALSHLVLTEFLVKGARGPGWQSMQGRSGGCGYSCATCTVSTYWKRDRVRTPQQRPKAMRPSREKSFEGPKF
jgi:hypothetical protein